MEAALYQTPRRHISKNSHGSLESPVSETLQVGSAWYILQVTSAVGDRFDRVLTDDLCRVL
jgi:hypothetical protein